jgi:hypothetical protein
MGSRAAAVKAAPSPPIMSLFSNIHAPSKEHKQIAFHRGGRRARVVAFQGALISCDFGALGRASRRSKADAHFAHARAHLSCAISRPCKDALSARFSGAESLKERLLPAGDALSSHRLHRERLIPLQYSVRWKLRRRLRRRSRKDRQATSQESASSPESPPKRFGPSLHSLFFTAACMAVLFLVCYTFPVLLPEDQVPPLGVLLLQLSLGMLALVAGVSALQSFTVDSLAGQLLERDPLLPPEWHCLYLPEANRAFYYNSETRVAQWEAPPLLPGPVTPTRTGAWLTVTYFLNGLSQQLAGILQPLMTAGLYATSLTSLWWCLTALYGARQLRGGLALFASACLLALPQPLPFLILRLSSEPYSTALSGVIASRVESALSVALLASLVPQLCSSLGTLHRAAKARLPKCHFRYDSTWALRLIFALCPAVSWRLKPYAFQLSRHRFAQIPLPSRVPLSIPVPRWELFGRSWTAILYAAPMVLPLARLLAAAEAAKAQSLGSSALCSLLLSSRPLQISACVSVVSVLLWRQKVVYAAAVEKQEKVVEGVELDSLDQKILADFDERLLVEPEREED